MNENTTSKTLAHAVARAAPSIPIPGTTPSPKMNSALSTIFSTTDAEPITELMPGRSQTFSTAKYDWEIPDNRYDTDTILRYPAPASISSGSVVKISITHFGQKKQTQEKKIPTITE